MIKKHEYVANDFSEDATVWKYMPLPAFLALLEDGKLYFTRADKLSDPNEFPIIENDAKAFRMSMEDYKVSIKRIKEETYFNCWRLSEYESFGMWNAYADSSTGIAIKTDVKSLFSSVNTPTDITAGKVSYIDRRSEMTQKWGSELNLFYITFAKTKPYENESELRLAFEIAGNVDKPEYVEIPVDPITLIKEVRVGSSSRPYVPDLIKKLLSHYRINVPVEKSIVR